MQRWGDEADESDDERDIVDATSPSVDLDGDKAKGGTVDSSGLAVPPTHTSRVDSKGIKLVTSYRPNPKKPGQLIKTVTKIRVTYAKVKESIDVEKRRKWKKFGQAAIDTDTSNVTIQSRDDFFMEDPHADADLQDEDPTKALSSNLNAFWEKQQRRQLARKFDVDADDAVGGSSEGQAASGGGLQKPAAGVSDADAADGWKQVGGDKGGSGGVPKYVPPGRAAAAGGGAKTLAAMAERNDGGGGGGRRFDDSSRDQNTIRVTNISEDTTEADLQDLFQRFGRISRVYLAKDKETMVSRGFAFVSFVHREDAARAMEKLQGYGYDHLILKLEWARPSAPKDPSKEGTVYRSGYGKALAQDTKEKVSFASNLTR